MLREAQALIEPTLRAAIERLTPMVRVVAEYHLGWVDSHGRQDNRPGKAVRPALTLLSAEAAGQPAALALPAAAAVELVHNFSLIQDDIMDDDRERRNRPAAWTVFGVNQALCASDALVLLAQQLLAEQAGLASGAASSALLDATQRMIAGQAVDVSIVASDVDRAGYLALAEAKTGALLGCAASIGALFDGADPVLVAHLRRFGTALGVMFQVVDDIHDVWGSPELTGRPPGSDRRNDRPSLPFGGGGYPEARAEAERQHGVALSVLHSADMPEAVQADFAELASYVLARAFAAAPVGDLPIPTTDKENGNE
jgi:geranylgeranyl diphosphate synthase type I